MRVIYFCIFMMVLLMSSSASKAAMYSYVDQYGGLHFTNVPGDPRYKEVKGYAGIQKATAPHRYQALINSAAERFNLEPELIEAIIKVESGFNPYAVSDKGAMGLMQLMPETVEDLKVRDPFDPAENIYGGTCYLRKLLDLFDGDLQLVLAAYNAGPNRVKEIGRVPRIAETKQYIRNVLANYKRYQAASSHSKKWVKVAYE